jgi:hypothetical protein
MVERFFRDLTENRLRRGAFRSVEELITAVHQPSTTTMKTPGPQQDCQGHLHPPQGRAPAPPSVIGYLHDALH